MKLRIKYEKTGVLRFISHLDVMRFFQKAIRRAKLDIKYTNGFSPHQIISFAAPMPLGLTSEGEYFDGEFVSVTSTEDMMARLNKTMPEGMRVRDIVLLPDGAKNSMSAVTASDYHVSQSEEAGQKTMEILKENLEPFFAQTKIAVVKKTKTKEELSDIRPFIYEIRSEGEEIYLLLASGSRENLKPDLVIEALCEFSGIDYNRYDYGIHRLETYMGEREERKPLSEAGSRF